MKRVIAVGAALLGVSIWQGTNAAGTIGPIRADRTVRARAIGASPVPAPQLGTVDFPDRRHGFLVVARGACGGRACSTALLATADGGGSWRQVSAADIASLSFLSPTVGFGVDGAGHLAETRDGGRRWLRRSTAPPHATAVDFVDARHGWLLAGGAYRTVDGGRHWALLGFRCGANQRIGRIDFVNARTGYLLCQVENGPFAIRLYRSSDGGLSWTGVSTVDRMAHILGPLDFVSARVGFTGAGLGDLRVTTDGGLHFQSLPNTPGADILSASWLSRDRGYAATNSVLVRTTDGGRHWRQVYPALLPTGAISLNPSGNGIGIGTNWDQVAVLQTGNGATWRQTGRLPATSVDGLVRTSSTSVWAVAPMLTRASSRVQVFHSRDGGYRWRRAASVPGWGGVLSFVGTQRGYLATTIPYRLYETVNGGKTWVRRQETVRASGDQFLSPMVAWAIDSSGHIRRTADGGQHWQVVPQEVSGLHADLPVFIDANHGWIAGTRCDSVPCPPVLLRTRDGGQHWTLIQLPASFASSGFDWVTPRIGYVQDGTVLYRTADGGTTWTAISSSHTPHQ